MGTYVANKLGRSDQLDGYKIGVWVNVELPCTLTHHIHGHDHE